MLSSVTMLLRLLSCAKNGKQINETNSSNKCIATSNKCLTSSNKKLLGTSATLVVTSALLVVTEAVPSMSILTDLRKRHLNKTSTVRFLLLLVRHLLLLAWHLLLLASCYFDFKAPSFLYKVYFIKLCPATNLIAAHPEHTAKIPELVVLKPWNTYYITSSNKCIATRNKCLTSSKKKLVVNLT